MLGQLAVQRRAIDRALELAEQAQDTVHFLGLFLPRKPPQSFQQEVKPVVSVFQVGAKPTCPLSAQIGWVAALGKSGHPEVHIEGQQPVEGPPSGLPPCIVAVKDQRHLPSATASHQGCVGLRGGRSQHGADGAESDPMGRDHICIALHED